MVMIHNVKIKRSIFSLFLISTPRVYPIQRFYPAEFNGSAFSFGFIRVCDELLKVVEFVIIFDTELKLVQYIEHFRRIQKLVEFNCKRNNNDRSNIFHCVHLNWISVLLIES